MIRRRVWPVLPSGVTKLEGGLQSTGRAPRVPPHASDLVRSSKVRGPLPMPNAGGGPLELADTRTTGASVMPLVLLTLMCVTAPSLMTSLG